MTEPRIAFHNRMFRPQPMDALHAEQVMNETAWTSYIYGIAAGGHMDVWTQDESETIDLDKLHEDAVSLSLGVLTIDLPHVKSCNRLICNCKIM